MGICMKPACLVESQRCRYCDEECQYYAKGEALLQAIECLPPSLSDRLKDLAHDITMHRIWKRMTGD